MQSVKTSKHCSLIAGNMNIIYKTRHTTRMLAYKQLVVLGMQLLFVYICYDV